MADVPATSSSPVDPTNDAPTKEVDDDAEMEDTQENAVSQPQENSSATLDHDYNPAEAHPTTSIANRNRKDATLREFLSKMDEYAPIVGLVTKLT